MDEELSIEEIANNICTNMAALEAAKPSAREVADALITMAPALDDAWQAALDNDALWTMRASRYGRLRTWWLRRHLRKGR